MTDYDLLWNDTEYMTEARSNNEFTEAASAQPRLRTGETTLDRAPVSNAASPADHAQPAAAPGLPATDRRKRKRAQVKMPASVRSSQSIRDSFREIVTTENASRDGLCFRTNSGHYQAGMKLRVTFPYSAHTDGASNSENPAEIVRLETLPDGSFRIAVTLNPPSYSAPAYFSGKASAGRPAKERRRHKRSEISAVSLLREEQSDAAMNARCSELSLGGCYIDTINPFLIGTRLIVEIKKDEQVFATCATVCSSHRGSGMGLSFHNLTPAEISLLSNWLS